MLKTLIQQSLSLGVQELFKIEIAAQEIQLDHPALEKFGDYSSNIALKIVNFLPEERKQSPLEVAKKLAEYLSLNDKPHNFSKIEAIAPGFINIFLSDQFLSSILADTISSEENHSSTDTLLVEHTGPNTNKPLHIGHVRNATLGTAILNIFKYTGQKVVAANINNDRGIHIIKSMYGYLIYAKKGSADQVADAKDYKTELSEWTKMPTNWESPDSLGLKPDAFVGKYYILGNNAYEDSEKEAEESGISRPEAPCNQMQQMLIDWESENPAMRALWKQNNNWFYQGMHQTLKAYNIHSPNDPSKFFDKEWYESEIYKYGKELVTEKIGNGIIQECEDGHVEANLQKYNLPNIVLLRKNKTSLYIIQDIELLRQRIQEDHNDYVLYLTDSGQNLRFKQLFAIAESLGIGKQEQMAHLGYGSVRLPEGKMSSRKGTVIGADWLLTEVKAKAIERINTERAEYSSEEKDQISNQVAVAAIKYGILKYNPMSNIVFDIESSLSFEGETGPYLQYTFARAASINRKYKEKYPEENTEFTKFTYNESELSLIRHIQKFEDWVKKSSESYSPNYLCEYLFNLAQKFNFFYTGCPILNEENNILRQQRLQITKKTQSVLKLGLGLLGIEAPEKM